MSKYLGILISPTGEEFYDAYGPMTKLRDRASRFLDAQVATGAAARRYGRAEDAFWNSEREHQARSREEYRHWTSRVEEVAEDDVKRCGHFVYDYPRDGVPGERLHATCDGDGTIGWDRDLASCVLWPERQDALEFIRTLPRHDGRGYAIDTY